MDGETTQTVIVYTKTHLQTIAFLGILVICAWFLDQPGSHQSPRAVERLGGAPESFCALKNSKTALLLDYACSQEDEDDTLCSDSGTEGRLVKAALRRLGAGIRWDNDGDDTFESIYR